MSHQFEIIFSELNGEQLSAVTFVQDYIQLWFDGPCINVTNPLTVVSNGQNITSWNPGFRDLLCMQISKIVQKVSLEVEKYLLIIFKDGSTISISLRPEDYTTPEAYNAHGFANNDFFVG